MASGWDYDIQVEKDKVEAFHLCRCGETTTHASFSPTAVAILRLHMLLRIMSQELLYKEVR